MGANPYYVKLDGSYAEPTKKTKLCAWVVDKKKCITRLATGNTNKYCFAHLSRGLTKDFDKANQLNKKLIPMRGVALRKKKINKRGKYWYLNPDDKKKKKKK